jgi:hypothetical protein
MLSAALRTRKPHLALATLVTLALLATLACTSCQQAGLGLLSTMPGVVNDPSNRALRASILAFGMGQFCHQMLTHDAPLGLDPNAPVIGRFFPQQCNSQQLTNGDYFVQFSGFGYGYTNLSKKLTFTMSGAVEYDADFQLSGGSMYIYFRPRQVTSSNFQSHVIEAPVANFLNSLSNVGDTFGKQLVGGQLQAGFTVVRASNGSTDFAVGILPVGQAPQHAIDVHGSDRLTWENARVDVHQNERDFVGPIEVTDSGRAIWVQGKVDGAPAVSVMLLRKDVGDASLALYYNYPQIGPLSAPPLAQVAMQQGASLNQAFKVDPGQYYVVFENSGAATPALMAPLAMLTDVAATVSYAVQIGDAP